MIPSTCVSHGRSAARAAQAHLPPAMATEGEVHVWSAGWLAVRVALSHDAGTLAVNCALEHVHVRVCRT